MLYMMHRIYAPRELSKLRNILAQAPRQGIGGVCTIMICMLCLGLILQWNGVIVICSCLICSLRATSQMFLLISGFKQHASFQNQ